MNKIKLFLAAGLFIALTAIKLVSPDLAFEIKQNTLRVIDYNDNYAEVAKYIDDLRFAEETPLPADESEPEPAYLPVEVTQDKGYQIKTLRTGTQDRLPTVFSHLHRKEAPEKAEEPLPDAVVTFLETQSAFAEYEIPDNATYEYEKLSLEYCSPVAGMTSSGFGYRVHPIHGDVRFHYGTDFAANSGTDILAFADGTVTAAGYDSGYGNYIKIDHGDGFTTLYAHCSGLLVSAGEWVNRGDRIGYVGASGLATGPHLHFELMKNGEYMNPEYYLGSA